MSEPLATAQFDSRSESVVNCIISLLADETDTHIFDFPHLHDAVDTDALDAVMHSAAAPVRCSFHYYDHRIVVENNGRVALYTPDESRTVNT